MLVDLINVPKNEKEWDIFSFAHRDSHEKIRKAIQSQKGINLASYVLEPINQEDTQVFLDNNSQAHTDMNGALGIQGSDLREVDLKDKEELRIWIYQHYTEHSDAEKALKI